MPENRDLSSCLADLVSDRQIGRKPTLPCGSRDLLEPTLKLALVDPDEMRTYRGLLRKPLQGRLPTGADVDERLRETVLNLGFGAIADDDLAALAVNPEGLSNLAEQLRERLPEAWMDAFDRDGRALMAEHGVSLPSFEDVTDSEPLLAISSLDGEDEGDSEVPIVWVKRFCKEARACDCFEGNVDDVAGVVATAEVRFRADGIMEVRTGGLLSIGPEYELRVEWRTEDAVMYSASAEPAHQAVVALTLGQHLPRPEDRLVVHHSFRQAVGAGWSIRVIWTLAEGENIEGGEE